MLAMMGAAEVLETFAYPACWVAGLIGGLSTRRWPLAAAIGLVLAPLFDYVGDQAFSDAQPHVHPVDSLIYAAIGGLTAVAIWAIASAIRRAWRR